MSLVKLTSLYRLIFTHISTLLRSLIIICNIFIFAPQNAVCQSNIVKAEYFFNTDPGFGNGVNIPVTASTTLNNVGFAANIDALGNGIHQFFIRVKDADGKWSISNRTFLYKVPQTPVIPDIVKAEYFFDTDPGFGNGNNIGIAFGNVISNAPFTANINSLNAGIHQLFIRVMDVTGKWSITNSTFLYKTSQDGAIPQIEKAEYFFDTDPGFGNGTNINLQASSLISDASFTADISSLATGIHQFFVRVKDATGNWSISNRTFLYKAPPFASPVSITKAEYFIDSDPGFGKGIPYPLTTEITLTSQPVTVNTTGLTNGTHKFYFRVMNSDGKWGISNVSNFEVSGAVAPPLISVTGIDKPYLCLGTILNVGYHATGTFNAGNEFKAELSDASGNFGAPVVIGTITSIATGGNIACTVPAGLAAGTGYKIRVRSTNTAYTGSPSTVSLEVSCGLPISCVNAVTPVNGSIGIATTGILNWSTATGNPTGYRIYLGTDSLNLQLVSTQPSTSYNYSLTINTKYYWKIVPYNVFDNATGCPVWSFTTRSSPPPCTQLIAPADNAVGVNKNTALSWVAGSGLPTGYFVKFGTDINNLVLYGTTNTSYQPVLQDNTTYFWQIVPYNANGSLTSCPVWKFTTVSCLPGVIVSNGPSILCAGQSRILTSDIAQSYLWSNGATTRAINVSTAGNYSVVINKGNGCIIGSNNISLVNDIRPVINSGNISSLCAGDNLTLIYSPVSSVAWSTGATTSSINVSPTTTTTYYVEGTSAAGCNYVDSIKITVNISVPPAAVTNMLPANATTALPLPFNLSWLPGANTSKYDLFVWPSNQSQPATPFAANLSTINYTINSPAVSYGTSYNWRVVAKNGNCYSTPGPAQSFTTRNLPDLIVDSLVVPTIVSTGNNISVLWKIKNNGTGSTGNVTWLDHIWLSQDTILQDDLTVDIYLGGFPNVTSLLVGESYINSATFTVPNNIGGEYRLFVKTNQLGTSTPVTSVIESNIVNNARMSAPIQVNITPSPDLQVNSIVIPGNAFSGTKIGVKWTVKNAGNDITKPSSNWKDEVYLSFSPTFSPNTAILLKQRGSGGILLHDSSYSLSDSITIPNSILGLYYIFVRTDVNNTVFEDPYENNNTNSSPLNIFLTPPPDLSVESFSTPTEGSNSMPLTVSWNVKNLGANPTSGQWTDKIYISSASTFNINNAFVIGSRLQQTELVQGSSYNSTMDVIIPSGYNGNYYLYVFVNSTNSLFEYTSTANNIKRSDLAIRVGSPDLTVDNILIPAAGNSGQNFSVSYRVNNTGAGNVFNATRYDSLFLSTQPVFSYATAIPIKRQGFSESLPAGTSITKQVQAILPNGISGPYYLFVKTDADNAIFENGLEGNNSGRSIGTTLITLTPSANLIVDHLLVPDTVRSGFKMPFSFSIKNIGTALAEGKTWNDRIYVSRNAVWKLGESTLLETFNRTQSLDINASYTVTDSVLINVSGKGELSINGYVLDNTKAFIHVITDVTDQVYEFNGENNNILASDSIFFLPPRIDLQVTSVDASDTAYSGKMASATWMVKNTGVSTLYKEPNSLLSWYDGVYLSLDTIWDASDVYVSEYSHSRLGRDSSYIDSRTFTVPDGLSGDYYLMVVTDHKKTLYEDVNRNNNYRVARHPISGEVERIHIILSPSPDLNVTELTVPALGIAGQPLLVNWTTKNIGIGNTAGMGWKDGIFLSTDLILSASDIQIGTKIHTNNLTAGQQYNDSLDITLPSNVSGNYVLIIASDYQNTIYEHQAENNNTKYSFINITKPPASDLTVTNIQPPVQALAGETVTINYTIKNKGIYPATGIMSDGLYLSRDSVWDIGDPLIATFSGTINLAPNAQTTRVVTTPVTGAGVGYYKVIVRTDRLNNIIESDDTNNSLVSNDSMNITVKQLMLNVLTPDTLINDKYLYYRIDIPAGLTGETLLITLKGDSLQAANEVYVKFGDVPGRTSYEFNHGTTSGGNQEVLVPSLQAGIYYIAVYGSRTANNQPITLKAEILPFAIRSVNSNKGGNTGPVTIELRGSKFEQGMQIKLDDGNGNVIGSTAVYFINSTKLFVSFNLIGKPLGYYDVIATKSDMSVAILDNGFQIMTGSGGGFYISGTSGTADPGCDPNATNGFNSLIEASILHPESARQGRYVAITVYYGNSGNVDLPVPIRFVFSKKGAPLSFTIAGLSENLQELSFEFKEAGGPPNILRPGATGAITFYTRAIALMEFLLSE